GLELYGIFLPVVLAIIGVYSGASAIGSEEDSGTLELLLASPVGRTRIVVEKSLSVSTQLAIVGMAVWFGVALGTLLFPFEVSLTHVLAGTLMGWLFGTTISYFSMCVQSITGKKGVAIGFGTGLVASSYIANVLSQLINGVSYLKYISIFYYYDGANVLIEGLEVENLVVLLVGSIIAFMISIRFFRVRDTGI
ncbi:MAG: ABC transporter permease subunit, partial [Chloroflexota bacterium]|nr:ABC transporter permease subunit [Chloroflexota bacterium]